MVQVIENWAYLVGRLGSLTVEPGAGTGTVEVDEVRDAEGWPNLLGELAGRQVTVHVPAAAHPAWHQGQRMALRARLGGPGVVWLSGRPEDHHPAD